jgi:catechol 2,3-dioxygenase-like lactoylglutathione lyase family enzyme
MADQEYIDAEVRNRKYPNKFGISRVDHIGIPCRDPELSGLFIEHVMGGVEFSRFGFSDEDRKLGRLRHIFYHIGDQLVEVVEQEDGSGYPEVGSDNSNPHVSFHTTPENVNKFVAHLKAEGIPFSGPRDHTGLSGVGVYFRDPDGNKLEVMTWDNSVGIIVDAIPMGGKHGLIPWSKLTHDWKPKQNGA